MHFLVMRRVNSAKAGSMRKRLSRRQDVDDVATARRDGNENWAFLLSVVGCFARNAAEVITAGDIITKP